MNPPNLPNDPLPKSSPSGDAPKALILDGILDGRVRDEAALRQAVAALSSCGAGPFRLEVTGGRFNVIPAETHVPPGGFDAAGQSNFLDRLQALVDTAQAGSIETNLRCKLLYAHEVAETLFVVKGGQIEPVTRRRPRTEHDGLPMAQEDDQTALAMRRREVLWVAPVLLLLGLFFAWQSGWVDRLLAARAEQMQTEAGPFQDMIAVQVERSWGNYQIKLTRGPGYPATTEALAARRDGSSSLTKRAACELVGNGDDLFVQIAQEDGTVLSEARTELRPLLGKDDGEVLIKLPGSMSAHHIVLSLSSGKQGK